MEQRRQAEQLPPEFFPSQDAWEGNVAIQNKTNASRSNSTSGRVSVSLNSCYKTWKESCTGRNARPRRSGTMSDKPFTIVRPHSTSASSPIRLPSITWWPQGCCSSQSRRVNRGPRSSGNASWRQRQNVLRTQIGGGSHRCTREAKRAQVRSPARAPTDPAAASQARDTRTRRSAQADSGRATGERASVRRDRGFRDNLLALGETAVQRAG